MNVPQSWVTLPIDKQFFANLDDDAVAGFVTAEENSFLNELGGHTRFPGMVERVDLGGNGRVYLNDLDGDLVAVCGGQVHRIDSGYNQRDVTTVPVAGGRRVVFAKTDRDDLMMAAGGPIVRLRAERTELLSSAAPLASHIAWVDGFTIAVEINSQRFFQSGAGEPDQWDPLDTFSADGSPDNINSLVVTPARELLLGGADSIEQFERSTTNSDVPFFRRWAIGGGVKLPYVLLYADNYVWTINKHTELVQFAGQQPTPVSASIALMLQQVDDWSDAWIGGYPDNPLHTLGQKFIIIQAPNATNSYGTKGITFAYDYGNKKFFTLYGWDSKAGAPRRWPGWSHWTLWDKTFVGGEGKVYELTDTTHYNGGELQRWLVRTSHITAGAGAIMDGFRLQVKRGIGTSVTAPSIKVRCSRDGRPFGSWITRSLGKAGERMQMIEFGCFGTASLFRFEIMSSDDCAIDLIRAEYKSTSIGH